MDNLTEIKITTPDLFTVPQVAKRLKRPKITLYRWIDTGRVTAIDIGGVLFIHRKEAERLQAEAEDKAKKRKADGKNT